jgi:hypothetical protein
MEAITLEDRITRIRPLGFGEILDMTFRIYRKRFRPIFVLTLLIYGPFYFLREMLGWLLGLQSQGRFSEPDLIVGMTLMTLFFILIALIMLILWPLWMAAITGISSGTFLRDESFTWIDGLRLSGKHGLKSALTVLMIFALGLGCGLAYLILLLTVLFVAETAGAPDWLLGLLVIFPTLIFILSMLIASIRLSLVFPVILEEGTAHWECLKRSWQLTKSSFWRIVGLLFSLVVIEGMITSIPSFISQSFLFNPSVQSMGIAITLSLTATFFFCLTTPLQAIAMLLVYVDRRARREGWDLEQRMNRLETTA